MNGRENEEKSAKHNRSYKTSLSFRNMEYFRFVDVRDNRFLHRT